MKKILFIFIITTLNLYSQKNIVFDFNLYSVYKPEKKSKEFKFQIVMTDSLDNYNSLIIIKNYHDLYAVITDYKLKLRHYFDVSIKKKVDSTNSPFKFKYAFSTPTQIFDCSVTESKRGYYIETVNNTNIIITCYTENNKEKTLYKYLLTGFETKSNYFNNFKSNFLYYFDNCKILPRNPKFIIKNAVILDNKGKDINKIELIEFGKIDVHIELEKLQYENLDYELNFIRNR